MIVYVDRIDIVILLIVMLSVIVKLFMSRWLNGVVVLLLLCF